MCAGNRRLGLLDADFQAPAILGPRIGPQQIPGGFEGVAIGLPLGDVGLGDGRIELDDQVAAMDRVAQVGGNRLNVPLQRRRQSHQPIRQRFAATDAVNGFFQRPRLGRARCGPPARAHPLIGLGFRISAAMATAQCGEATSSPPIRQILESWENKVGIAAVPWISAGACKAGLAKRLPPYK